MTSEPSTRAPGRQSKFSMQTVKKIFGGDTRQLGMIFALVALIIFFQVWTGGLTLTPDNVINLFQGNSYILVLAIGMVLVAIRDRAGLQSENALVSRGAPSAAYGSLGENASVANMVFGVRQSLFIELTILGFAMLSVLAFGMRTQRAMVRIQALRLLTSARSESLRERTRHASKSGRHSSRRHRRSHYSRRADR